ncbi:MAG: hypothetical protein RIM84_17120 [Alphaproteobacteria bacterium]
MAGRNATDNDKGSRRAAPSLTIDYALYDKHLEGSTLSEDQKREFLDAMWSIIVEFVMLGFEVHPAQAAQDACGKRSRRSPESTRAAVQSKRSKKNHFERAASGSTARAAERIQE